MLLRRDEVAGSMKPGVMAEMQSPHDGAAMKLRVDNTTAPAEARGKLSRQSGDFVRALRVLAAAVVLLAGCGPAPAAREGTVAHIEDGDTIILRDHSGARTVIRLADYDAPETAHLVHGKLGQPGGSQAKAELQRLVRVGERVTAQCYSIDSRDRPYCHVFTLAGVHLNLEMIRSGWGWVFDRPDWVHDPRSYAAQEEARAQRRGAWSLPGQMTPELWRRRCWGGGHCPNAST